MLMSQNGIAVLCGVSQGTIWKWMKRYEIAARKPSETQGMENNGAWKDSPIKDIELFKMEYEENGMSLRQIAVKYDISLRTAARWLKIHGIKARTVSEWIEAHPKLGADNHNWKGGASRYVCSECGKVISFGSSLCNECYHATFVGNGNPNYKGIADITVIVRGWAYDYWRPLVFARDGYTCQKCGDSTGGNLNAHHIIHLSSIIRILLDGVAVDTPEDRFLAIRGLIDSHLVSSISNGVTLCSDCHKEVHCVV